MYISSFISGGRELKIATVKDLSNEKKLIVNLLKEKDIQMQKDKETVFLKKEKELTKYALQENINQILASVKLCLFVAQNNETLRKRMIAKGLANVTIAMKEVSLLYKSL